MTDKIVQRFIDILPATIYYYDFVDENHTDLTYTDHEIFIAHQNIAIAFNLTKIMIKTTKMASHALQSFQTILHDTLSCKEKFGAGQRSVSEGRKKTSC